MYVQQKGLHEAVYLHFLQIFSIKRLGYVRTIVYIYYMINKTNTYFVVRDTDHPEEDIKRGWSSFAGGSANGEQGGQSEEEARINFASHLGIEVNELENEFRFHPAYDEFVAVHYEGLGGYLLDAESIEDAILEAAEYDDGLAVTSEAGDGHFFAEDVVSYHKVREGRYIFEVK